jgi:hypothetical protein
LRAKIGRPYFLKSIDGNHVWRWPLLLYDVSQVQQAKASNWSSGLVGGGSVKNNHKKGCFPYLKENERRDFMYDLQLSDEKHFREHYPQPLFGRG